MTRNQLEYQQLKRQIATDAANIAQKRAELDHSKDVLKHQQHVDEVKLSDLLNQTNIKAAAQALAERNAGSTRFQTVTSGIKNITGANRDVFGSIPDSVNAVGKVFSIFS